MATEEKDVHSAGRPPYKPLPAGHIRVLELKPGDPGSPLEAQLLQVQLQHGSSEPQTHQQSDLEPERDYEAISYCWGEVSLPRSIDIAGEGNIDLTESLYSALQSLRHVDRSRHLWADAICINQDDISERSAQVAMMGTIYAKARCVLVWLGTSSADGSEVLAFTLLSAKIEPRGDRSRSDLLSLLTAHLQNARQCGCCQQSITVTSPAKLVDALAAVAKLLERSWFERLWVVQEVALARKVEICCSQHHAPWRIFTEVARVPGQYQGDDEYADTSLPPALPRAQLRQVWARINYLNQLRDRNVLHKDRDPFKPTALCKDLLMMSDLRCREPHDRIFGVSRVLGLDKFDALRADYNVAVAELYRRTTAAFLTSPANRSGARTAVMLALAGTEDPEAELSRPSWVPHFQFLTERSRSKYTFYQWTLAQRPHYADAVYPRYRITSSAPEKLMVRGKAFARVNAVLRDSQCPSKHVHRRSGTKCPDHEGVALIKWYSRCNEFLAKQLPGDSHQFAKLVNEVFCMNHATNRSAPSTSLHVETISAWMAQIPPDERFSCEDLMTVLTDLRPYITGAPHDRERLLCIVDGEHGARPAWVSATVQLGDHICWFGGAPYPFVLRPNGDGTFSLLGDAFVQGLDEHKVAGSDLDEWNGHQRRFESANADLRFWMESDERKGLRQRSESRAELHMKDKIRKEAFQESTNRIKAYYRATDESMSWIDLR